MYQNYKKSLRQPAIDLRLKGLSFSEIQNQIQVPKSTLSYWLKDVKLTPSQQSRLKKKRIDAAEAGTKKKVMRTKKMIEEIQRTSARDIKEISKRELWLMGTVLYWRERFLNRNDNDLKRGVRFSSSDPHIIKFFLKWLEEVGRLKKAEIGLDIFINSDKKARINGVIEKWAKITEFPKKSFSHVYYLRGAPPKKGSKIGILRIRVKASSMLARQLSGWIRGIERFYWHEK